MPSTLTRTWRPHRGPSITLRFTLLPLPDDATESAGPECPYGSRADALYAEGLQDDATAKLFAVIITPTRNAVRDVSVPASWLREQVRGFTADGDVAGPPALEARLATSHAELYAYGWETADGTHLLGSGDAGTYAVTFLLSSRPLLNEPEVTGAEDEDLPF